MEEALHAAVKSEGTVMKSETKVKGFMDSIIESGQTINEQKIEFEDKLDAEYKKCLRLVIKEFDARAGREETIPEALVETWQDFRNHRTKREVQRSKKEMTLKWLERLQVKHTELYLHEAVATLVDKICAETSNMPKHKRGKAEAEMHFKKLWEPEERKYRSFVHMNYSEEQMKKKVDDIYAVVCSNRFNDQPNDFDDLIDSKKEDLTVNLAADLPIDLANMGVHNMLTRWRSNMCQLLNRTEKIVRDVLTDMQIQLQCHFLIQHSSSLQNDIENAVQEINANVKNASRNGPADLAAWTSQLAKAAHWHLYRNIIGRVASLSREAKEEHLKNLAKLEEGVKEHFVAEVTGRLNDRDLYSQITTKLSNAFLKHAISPTRLGLRASNVSDALLSHFSISSPEMVEEVCYDNLFMCKNDDLLFTYITNRSATTNATWENQYQIGERAICNLSYEKVDKIFLGPGCDFDNLKIATEELFRQNEGKKVSVKYLLTKLNEQFKFLHINDHLMPLAISSVNEVRPSMIKSLWPDASTMIQRARTHVGKYVEDLRPRIKNLTYGCIEVCPFCETKCKYPVNHVVSHECHRHLITGFGGCQDVESREIDTSYCTGSAFNFSWHYGAGKKEKVGSFYECLTFENKNRNPTWKITHETAEIPPLEQREAFKRLKAKIAAHLGLNPAKTFW